MWASWIPLFLLIGFGFALTGTLSYVHCFLSGFTLLCALPPNQNPNFDIMTTIIANFFATYHTAAIVALGSITTSAIQGTEMRYTDCQQQVDC